MGKISYADRVFVAVVGTGVAEAATGRVDVVVVGVVVPFEAASFRLREGFRTTAGRDEGPSNKGVPNLTGREAGLLPNAERSSAVS